MSDPSDYPAHAGSGPGGPATSAPPTPSLVMGPKPPGVDYGYVENGLQQSTREQLVERLRQGRPTPLVWTPESEGIVPPWAVPYLFTEYRRHGLRHHRRTALIWLFVCAATEIYAVLHGRFSFLSLPVLLGFFAGTIGFYSALEWGRFGRLTPDQLTFRAQETRARPRARSGPARYTQVVAGALTAVVVVESLVAGFHHRLIGGEVVKKGLPIWFGMPSNILSVDAAGIVQQYIHGCAGASSTHCGEYWRLVTGAFVHDGLVHFAMNTMALLALGRFIEVYGHRAYVPIVFFFTAVVASTASYLHMPPDGASLGASGGIMGLFGFLAVMARRRREVMPPGFGKAITVDICVIAAMGIFGAGYVDNWAHGGGFAAGAFLGWLMIPRPRGTAYWEPSVPIRRIGDVALGLVVLSALGTIWVLVLRLLSEMA